MLMFHFYWHGNAEQKGSITVSCYNLPSSPILGFSGKEDANFSSKYLGEGSYGMLNTGLSTRLIICFLQVIKLFLMQRVIFFHRERQYIAPTKI